MDVRDAIIKPCDMVQIPVYATYRGAMGIVATKAMFYLSDAVILRYVEDTGKNKNVYVSRPACFEDGKNYWNTDERKWVIV